VLRKFSGFANRRSDAQAEDRRVFPTRSFFAAPRPTESKRLMLCSIGAQVKKKIACDALRFRII
jgi:hypothetical protein